MVPITNFEISKNFFWAKTSVALFLQLSDYKKFKSDSCKWTPTWSQIARRLRDERPENQSRSRMLLDTNSRIIQSPTSTLWEHDETGTFRTIFLKICSDKFRKRQKWLDLKTQGAWNTHLDMNNVNWSRMFSLKSGIQWEPFSVIRFPTTS